MEKIKLSEYAGGAGLSVAEAFRRNMGKGVFYTAIMGDIILSYIPVEAADFEVRASFTVDFVRLPESLEKKVFHTKKAKLSRLTDSQIFEEQILGDLGGFNFKSSESVDGIYRIVPGVLPNGFDAELIEKTAVVKMNEVLGGGDKPFLKRVARSLESSEAVSVIKYKLSELYIEAERSSSPQPCKDNEPEVIKGKPKTLRSWILWKIQNDGFNKDGLLPYGYQSKLIDKSYGCGYQDDSAVKKACKFLKLKFAAS